MSQDTEKKKWDALDYGVGAIMLLLTTMFLGGIVMTAVTGNPLWLISTAAAFCVLYAG